MTNRGTGGGRRAMARGKSAPDDRAAPATSSAQKYPHRDADGRVINATEMVISVITSVAIVTVLLIAVDGLASVAGRGSFGRISGWPAAILAVWLFIEDFRAWKIGPARIGVALVAAALGALAGGLLASVLGALPPLFAGALGALLACLIYAMIWFFGVRLVAYRTTER
jgi:hypothetical protein